MAKAAIDYSGFVSLSQMLDCLHDGDVAALCRPARFCRYSPRFLASCLTRLKKLSVRVRGIVDRGDAEWVELLDYRIGYLRVPMRGRDLAYIARLESHFPYPAAEVKNRGAPVHRTPAVEPRYRRIVDNVRVEIDLILRAMGRAWWVRQIYQRCLPSPSRVWWT